MFVRVIVPPGPIVTPADIAGDHAADSPAVIRMINAAQRTIDGPTGWLNRAIGEQTLELVTNEFCGSIMRLPFPPIIEIISITFLGSGDVEHVFDPASYRLIGGDLWLASGASFPSTIAAPDAVRVRYRAGYDGEDVVDGGTGPVPDEAKQAVILLTQGMISASAENLYLRSVEVPDVLTETYTVSDQADGVIKRQVSNLLSGLRIFAV